MFSLDSLLGQQGSNEVIGQLSKQVGAQPDLVNSAIQMALPMIVGGLARNASTPDGAGALANALQNDHDGSILDNLGSLLGGGAQTPQTAGQTDLGGIIGSILGGGQQAQQNPATDAGGILGHIFGPQQGKVAEQVSQQSGLNMGQVAQILLTLAPLVMGYLGKQQRTQNLDPNGLSNYLGQQTQQAAASGNPMMDMVGSFLDKDHDGSAMDDIASMAMKYITGR
jgi:hypothetical protein